MKFIEELRQTLAVRRAMRRFRAKVERRRAAHARIQRDVIVAHVINTTRGYMR